MLLHALGSTRAYSNMHNHSANIATHVYRPRDIGGIREIYIEQAMQLYTAINAANLI